MKYRKSLTAILTLLMVVSLAACSGGSTGSEDASSAETATEEQTDETTAATGKVLVLYFSADNTKDADAVSSATPMVDGSSATKWIAEIIHEEMGGDIFLPVLPAYIGQAERLQDHINHRNFDFRKCTEESRNEQLREQNMPPGTQGIRLIADDTAPTVEVYWLSCYVVLERTSTNSMTFRLYRAGDGKPIDDLFPILDTNHKPLQKFLLDMFKAKTPFSLDYKITETLSIPIKEKDDKLASGVTVDRQGNYHVTLTNDQLVRISKANEKDATEAMMILVEGCGIVKKFEPGRLVRFSLTADQEMACSHFLKRLRQRAETD